MLVFLSHSTRDKPTALKLASKLELNGIEVWFDSWNIRVGDSITQEIQQGLGRADFVIVLLSKASVKSGWVEKEWQSRIGTEATLKRTIILPVLVEQCEIPVLLQDKKYADLSVGFDTAISEIISAITKQRVNDSPAQQYFRFRRAYALSWLQFLHFTH